MKESPITINDILIRELKAMGAEGLCNPELECGCGLDDLCPGCSDCNVLECRPAKKILATTPGECWEIGEEIFVPMEEG